jgi:hypothetical protein
MNRTNSLALCLASVQSHPWDSLPRSVWDAADTLGELSNIGEVQPIARPSEVGVAPMRLAARRWPDCPLCKADVNACRCDPDDYAAAVAKEKNDVRMA